VLDFSPLLPGLLATLVLAEAGVDVVKLERPARARTRRTELKIDGASTRGFEPRQEIHCAGSEADGVVENHYVGDAGVPSLSRWPDAQPTIPLHALVDDIGGGIYPAVVNILLALRERDRPRRGVHLDIVMAEDAFDFAYGAHAKGVIAVESIGNGADWLTGELMRYRLYTAVDWQIAVAALKEKFWRASGDVIGCKAELRDDLADPEASITEVAAFWRFARPRTGRHYCRGRLLLH
jgi:crotonobetainyl-CoA:carnitine CoA-transferase CaiB-like acyl-CoA transferase